MPWQKGQSGNPGGRSQAQANIEKLARDCAPKAIKALVAALDDPKSAVQAAKVLLDRGFGMPAQQINANVNVLDTLSDGSVAALVAALENSATGSSDYPGGMPTNH